MTSVDFSSDESYVLTASTDGTAKLWPLADAEVHLRRPTVVLRDPHEDAPDVTTARISPTNPRQVVFGTRGGWVVLWEWDKGRGKIVLSEKLEGPVNATTTLVYYLYEEGFVGFNAGRAGVAAVVLFVAMLAITLVQMRYTERSVHYA